MYPRRILSSIQYCVNDFFFCSLFLFHRSTTYNGVYCPFLYYWRERHEVSSPDPNRFRHVGRRPENEVIPMNDKRRQNYYLSCLEMGAHSRGWLAQTVAFSSSLLRATQYAPAARPSN